MQLVGRKATNSVYTTRCLLLWTSISLSWLPGGGVVMHTCSTGAASYSHCSFGV